MDAHLPTGWGACDLNGVIEILGVIWIDGEDEFSAQIESASRIALVDLRGDTGRVALDVLGELSWEIVFADDREHVNARRIGRSKHLDDTAFGVEVAAFPGIEFCNHLVARFGFECGFGGGDVEVFDDAGIVWNDVIEFFGLLECANDGRVCAGEDADDPAFDFC